MLIPEQRLKAASEERRRQEAAKLKQALTLREEEKKKNQMTFSTRLVPQSRRAAASAARASKSLSIGRKALDKVRKETRDAILQRSRLPRTSGPNHRALNQGTSNLSIRKVPAHLVKSEKEGRVETASTPSEKSPAEPEDSRA
ncbi:hypothetical protein MRB53_037037 [Persea americana]|nr:hypothetical protein MRB53_037037 [Persea americana]